MLIRAVRSVNWQMSDRDMGLDPAARPADGHTFHGPSYPSFVVGTTAGQPSRPPPNNNLWFFAVELYVLAGSRNVSVEVYEW
jgi:hypothetical protein